MVVSLSGILGGIAALAQVISNKRTSEKVDANSAQGERIEKQLVPNGGNSARDDIVDIKKTVDFMRTFMEEGMVRRSEFDALGERIGAIEKYVGINGATTG